MTSPNTIIADLMAEVETLRKQRDELISALHLISNYSGFYHTETIADIARTTISHVKGGS